MHSRLPSYLRTYRLRSGLSQRELAFLLGAQSGAKISRYERRVRTPNIHAAFACEAIFKIAAHELFPAAYAEVDEQVTRRVRLLLARLKAAKPTPANQRKIHFLIALIEMRGGTPRPRI